MAFVPRVALLLSCITPSLAEAPHIIFILADDLGFGDCGFTGVSDIHTPNIDSIVNDPHGVRLSNYYGQPVCSPSRAAIQTGRLPLAYGLQTYVIDPAGVDYGLFRL